MEFSFFIPGTPAPGGSKRAFVLTDKKTGQPLRAKATGRIIVNVTDDAGPRNKEWKSVVTIYGRGFMRGAPPYDEAMKVEFTFYLRRPMKHFRTGKNCHMLREDAPLHHTTKPDVLKLTRSTEDALTGVIWKDDSSNVRICQEKRYLKAGEKEGCAVRFVLLRSPSPSVTQPDGAQ